MSQEKYIGMDVHQAAAAASSVSLIASSAKNSPFDFKLVNPYFVRSWNLGGLVTATANYCNGSTTAASLLISG